MRQMSQYLRLCYSLKRLRVILSLSRSLSKNLCMTILIYVTDAKWVDWDEWEATLIKRDESAVPVEEAEYRALFAHLRSRYAQPATS